MSIKLYEPCPHCTGTGYVESNSFHDVHTYRGTSRETATIISTERISNQYSHECRHCKGTGYDGLGGPHYSPYQAHMMKIHIEYLEQKIKGELDK